MAGRMYNKNVCFFVMNCEEWGGADDGAFRQGGRAA